jgi:hypothetical protein
MAESAPKPEFTDPKLAAAVARLGATIAANPKKHQPEPPPPAKVYQLPLWPEPVRGAPNSFLRSALFAAIQGKTRRWMKKELLATMRGVAVSFTGQQLDQSDLDVWEQAVQLSRHHPLGHICHFRANAFLTALGRRNGKTDYEWLHSAITRLIACAVEIRSGSRVFTGSVLSSCVRDEASGIYKLTLDPQTVNLYRSTDWTAIQWQERQALIGKPLALWLHGFYSSHAEPYPMKVETLKKLSGSGTKRLAKFKENLKAALTDLEAATGIKSRVEGDLARSNETLRFDT